MADALHPHKSPTSLPSKAPDADVFVNDIMPFKLADLGADHDLPQTHTAPIQNIPLDLRIELGRAHLSHEAEAKLSHGAVVPLNKATSDSVEVFANGRLIARGEVVVVNENLCVRVAEIIVPKAA
jgi:flagellar motor switch protein FliN